ncbi:helix-loop-helix DNA-binding domain-containing protein [Penicillium nucicola]|uniref:helix-loop-helix DNA-binding domain-containing protein n=1 Tax=Penicillium nucicola TaxID=1850975 RepID=UPI0025456AD4|nr:helix-loop-helix DNA-binding domain-containing protein [Penicillium nucicola]KAJ5762186.1 helix-loop-helix DNA-binding domain-containing protein [Penicillium nucicola]
MSDNHGTPHNWSSIDLNLVAQTGQNIQNATFNLNPTLTTEGGTACHGKVLSRSHHTSRSGSEAATDGPRYQRSKRVSHYRIEKKYRTNINDKIRLLNEMLPENLQCAQLCMDTEREDINIATTKSKAAAKRSKGDVLSLVIDYIVFLQKKDLLQKQRIQDLEDCLWTSKHWSFE